MKQAGALARPGWPEIRMCKQIDLPRDLDERAMAKAGSLRGKYLDEGG